MSTFEWPLTYGGSTFNPVVGAAIPLPAGCPELAVTESWRSTPIAVIRRQSLRWSTAAVRALYERAVPATSSRPPPATVRRTCAEPDAASGLSGRHARPHLSPPGRDAPDWIDDSVPDKVLAQIANACQALADGGSAQTIAQVAGEAVDRRPQRPRDCSPTACAGPAARPGQAGGECRASECPGPDLHRTGPSPCQFTALQTHSGRRRSPAGRAEVRRRPAHDATAARPAPRGRPLAPPAQRLCPPCACDERHPRPSLSPCH